MSASNGDQTRMRNEILEELLQDLRVLRLARPRPVLASFIAAAVALLPALLAALHEAVGPSGDVSADNTDDASMRVAMLGLFAMPLIYVIAIPVCHLVGTLLVRLNLRRFWSFLAGAAVVACVLGTAFGLSRPARFGWNDLWISIAAGVAVFLVTALPAAACWWVIAVQPHNSPLNTDAPKGGAPVS